MQIPTQCPIQIPIKDSTRESNQDYNIDKNSNTEIKYTLLYFKIQEEKPQLQPSFKFNFLIYINSIEERKPQL